MSTAFNTPIVSRLADADMQAAPTALARAAHSARELAARTRTPLAAVRDGKSVDAVVQHDLAKQGHGVAHKH